MSDEAEPLNEEEIEKLRKGYEAQLAEGMGTQEWPISVGDLTRFVGLVLATLDQRTQERDEARAEAARLRALPEVIDRGWRGHEESVRAALPDGHLAHEDLDTIVDMLADAREQLFWSDEDDPLPLRARVKELEAELTTYREIVELVAADGFVVGEVRDLPDLDYPNLREAIARCYDIVHRDEAAAEEG